LQRKFILFSLIIIFFIILPSTITLAEETELFSTGVYVVTPINQEVEREGVATYIFQIDNFNPTPISLNIKFFSSQGWPLLGGADNVTIEPNGKEYIVISVMVPSSVIGGTEDDLELVLSTREVERSFTVKTRVKNVRNLKMEVPRTYRSQAGEDLLLPVQIINNGTLEETFSLTVESENGWIVYWDNPDFSILTPSETGTALIRCRVPEFTLHGTTDKLTLYLTTDSQQIEKNIKVLVIESQDYIAGKNLNIPFNSILNFTYLRPEPDWNSPWNLTWRTRGKVLPQTKLDLYLLTGQHKTINTNMFMGLTGHEWLLRAGTLGHSWNSLIAPPTYSSIFYLHNYQHYPWSLYIGSLSPSYPSSPLWWGGDFELTPFNLRLMYLHNAEKPGYFEDALASEYKFPSSPVNGWGVSVQGVAGFGGEEVLSQGGITINHLMPEWELLSEFKSGRDFYSTTHFNEFTLGGSSYALEDLTIESSLTFKTEKRPEEKPFPIWKFKSAIYPDNGSLAFAHTNRLDGVINEIKAKKTYNQQQNRFSLSVSMIDERLLKQKRYFLFYGKYRYRFSSENYIESVFEDSITKDNTLYHLPSLGIRWSYSPNYYWKSYGMFEINLPPKESPKLANFQSILKYKTSIDTTLQINLNLSLPDNKPTYYMGLSLYHEDLFVLPSPWCGIHGKAFIDLNRNGKYDHGEPGLANLPVLLNGKKVSVTEADGRWEIPLTSKGKHLVSLPQNNEEYYTVQSDFEIVTEINKSVFVSTPYLPPLSIQGIMFLDDNNNGIFDPKETVLPGVKILVYNSDKELVFQTIVERDGVFYLSLPPGKYQLTTEENTLPAGTLIPEALELEVDSDSPVSILYPVAPQKKEIEFFNDPDPEVQDFLLDFYSN
jgi:hypothetical protein